MNQGEFHKMFGAVLTAAIFPTHVFAVIDAQAPGPPAGLTQVVSEPPSSPGKRLESRWKMRENSD
jgi:hypothetical protein